MLYRIMLPILMTAAILTVAADAQLPNLTYKNDPNWQYPLVPTISAPGTSPVVVPALLPGNSGTIYYNTIAWNNGSVATPTGPYFDFMVDGTLKYATVVLGPVGPGQNYLVYDLGPFSVRGGRHTWEAVHDPDNVLLESNESDNWWAHQFIFTPYVLSPSTPKTRGTPPDRTGGFSSIIDGSPIYANCDGFRFASTGYWNAITMYAENNAEDYDLELFAPSTGSEDGFISPICSSTSIEGYLEAVIVNGNTVGVADYDVGVTNYSGTGQFVIEHVVNSTMYVGDSIPVTLGTNEYLRIWDTYIGDTGWVTVKVDDPSADGEAIKVAWIEQDVTEIEILNISGWETTDENGRAALHRDFTATGWYGLVVYRDPLDGGVTKPIQIDIEMTPPDLRPLTWPDWHSSLVPTPVQQFLNPIPLPDTLHGYMPETYLNYSVENNSPVASPPADLGIFQDGLPWYIPSQILGISPFGGWTVVDGTGREIPGGRHTLSMNIDHTEAIHEIYEDNNIYGEQYCWSPWELGHGQQFSHFAPGPQFGGIETIASGEVFQFNCDGYRFYTGYSNWEGLALTQGPNSDYDLSIHYPLSGVKDGFNDYLAGSSYQAEDTDYVLFNNNVLPAGVYDIGVENFIGDEPYTIEAVGSPNLPVPVSGHHGPFTMQVGNALHLYNIYLEQDIYAFRLDELIGVVDWGFALHPHDLPMMGRYDIVTDGASWLNGPGDPEWFTVDVPAAGWYGLAVYKATPYDFEREGTYKLTILQGVSDVDDPVDIPSATMLAGVHPNPFNPQTTISYELAVAAEVDLKIYDVKGALVRRLVNESMPAGRHAAVWNGEDDGGARVASGVYLARFSAGAYRDFTKLVMLK